MEKGFAAASSNGEESMIRRLKQFVRGIVERGRYIVILVPFRDRGEHDVIGALAPYVLGNGRLVPARIRIEEAPKHFEDLSRSAGLRIIPSRIILFAHSALNMQGFAVNPGPDGGDVLLLRWWQRSEGSYEILLAFVCRGAEILSRPLWRETFPIWVSFRADIQAFLASAKGTELWARIAERIVQATLASRSAMSLKARLESLFSEEMADLWDSLDPKSGDNLNVVYLEKCIDSLSSSED